MVHILCSLLVYLFLFNTVVCNNVGQTQKSLYKYLFEDYIKELKPLCTADKAIDANIGISFRQMFEMNELKQRLLFNAWMRLSWQDCQLQWNTDDCNLKNITIPASDIWKPDITIYDHVDGAHQRISGVDNYLATIHNNGFVSYMFPTVIEVLCKIDVTYFPFDEQTCTLLFSSWAYTSSSIRLTPGDIGSSYFVPHIEWDFVGVSMKSFDRIYLCCPEDHYSHVSFNITLRRKPLSHVWNLLFPCAGITVVSLFGYLLPPECGEKVSLQVTVLLSMAVFLHVVAEELPASSDTVPYIEMHFLVSVLLVSLSTLSTTFVINIHYRGLQHKKVPRWLHWLFFQCIGPLMLVNSDWTNDNYEGRAFRASVYVPNTNYCNAYDVSHNNWSTGNSQIKSEKETTSNMSRSSNVFNGKKDQSMYQSMVIAKKQLNIMEKAEQKTMRQINHQVLQDEWRQIGIIADRFFFVLFTAAMTFETMAVYFKMTGVF